MRRPESLLKLTLSTLAWTLLGIGAAYAPGSITLDEVMDQLKDEPTLISEMETQLKAQNLKAEAVICIGARFGGNWANLGGARAVPYECEVGSRKLEIEGTIRLYDKAGKELDMDDPKAPELAVDYKQTDLKWAWK
jgi:hypothetical protein